MSALTPVAPRERIATLDVLRGFALLGVLLGNSYWLYSARFLEAPPDTSRFDAIARWIQALLVESKAQTLLTFLFGFGFAAQLLRAEARHEPVMGIYLRRLFVLLAIGLLHVMLWWGDVTWTYAVAGFALLLFLRTSDRARLVWAALLTFGCFAFGTWPSLRAAAARLVASPATMEQTMKSFAAAIHGKRFWPVVPAHLRVALVWEAPIYLWYYAWLLGRFLVGYVAGTQRWFDDDGAGHLPLFRRFVLFGLVADVPAAVLTILLRLVPHAPHRLGPLASVAVGLVDQLGLLGLTAAYVGVIVLLMQRPSWRSLLTLIAPAGRMPLTTYISQSVISTFLYYGWGLGLAGTVRSARCVMLALAIFALQVVAAHLWLRRFRFGPLEWIWRALVYLQLPPMRVR
ncbi:MAG TPA: DUF418 domain-containing protein [Polyangia bacterium]|nr:DUF418 domain-containing protein [Polyangia bacterium]